MKKLFTITLISCAATLVQPAQAGGILTNTNQNIAFLRNPARDAAIGIDGVYTNPAGVAFMDDGWHLSLNWQYAHQTRTILTTNPDFVHGMENDGRAIKKFKGNADAPIIPSIQAAYNKGKWSLQANFAVTGGGGKCTFSDGIGSFESAVAAIAGQMINTSQKLNAEGIKSPMVTGYDVNGFMRGRQFYFGFTLGAAYKLTDNISVYGGARLLYGTASYKARLDNIRVMTQDDGAMSLSQYFGSVTTALNNTATYLSNSISSKVGEFMATGMTQEEAMATPEVQALLEQGKKLQATAAQLEQSGEMLAPYADGVNLQSDQSGWGIAPIIGIDYKVGDFNFAAKYEFKTRMRMKNSSTVKEAHAIDAVNKFRDDSSVPEDQPALFTVGAQWSVLPSVRVNAGYHLFFDKSAHWYKHEEKKLDGNTWEWNAGAEWDITDKLTVSGGFQKTNYGLSDEYMNDMSFVVSSYTFGFGVGYQVSKKVRLNAAYFQTNYDTYHQQVTPTAMNGTTNNDYTRTNNVFGLGCDINF